MIHLPLYAQSYESLWKRVGEAEDKGLPKTVMDLSDKIFRKAKQEKNAPQMFKAYLYKARSQEEVTPDSIYPNFRFVEQWVKQEPNAVNRAILHSMLSGMYQDYLDRHSYELYNRTELAEDEVPDDMREWTRGIFERQALAHANAVLEDVPALLKSSAKQYEPFSILGKGSEFYGHDMFHLLAKRTIGHLKELGGKKERIDEVYQLIIKTYEGMKGREEATLMATLDYVDWKSEANEDRYRELITKYDQFPAVMEAYHRLASFLYRIDRPAEALQLIDLAVAKYPKYVRVNMLHRLKDDILHPYLSADMQQMLYPGDKAELKVDFKNLQAVEVKLYRTNLQELPESEEIKKGTLEKLGLQEVMNRHYELTYAPAASGTPSILEGELNSTKALPRGSANPQEGEESHSFNLEGELNSTKALPLRKGEYPEGGREYENTHYLRHKNTFELEVPTEPGVYLLSIAPTTDLELVSYQYMVVSRMKVLLLSLGDGCTEVVTLDSKTGQPIGGVEVTFFRGSGYHYHEICKFTTDAEGKYMFVSPERNYLSYVARKDNDRAMLKQSAYVRNEAVEHEVDTERHLTLLTDRSIYRPGQTVYVKGICYTQKGEDMKVAENKAFKLTLHDVNGKELTDTDVVTNDFGSFNASFVLPTAALNGQFSIRADGDTDARVRFRVEEYKRPTFEITFESIREAYRMGDTVELKGHVESFSGATVQNVPLLYRITGNIWRWWVKDGDPQGADSVMVDDKGDFVIPIQLKTNDGDSSLSISVEATVTNEAGETQTASRNIWATSSAYTLGFDVPQYLNGSRLTVNGSRLTVNSQSSIFNFQFSISNADGQEQDRNVRYRLYRVEKDTDKYEEVKKQAPVEEGVVKGNEKHAFDNWSNLPSAKYMIELTVEGEEGLPEKQQSLQVKSFYLYRDTDQTFGTWMDTFLDSSRDRLTFDEQHAASFIFGTSHQDAYVLMDVFADGKRIDSQALKLNNELKAFAFPYQIEYGDGLTILFTFVKDDKVYERSVMIEKTKLEKQLDMKWEVFRDKLQPGQQEEWRLVIKTPDGAPAAAEMLALLYDASLDKIYKSYQSLFVYVGRRLYSASHNHSGNSRSFWSFAWKNKEYKVPEWVFDALDIPRLRFFRDMDYMVLESAPMAVGRASTRLAKQSAVVLNATADFEEAITETENDQQSTVNGQRSMDNDQPSLSVRSNFNETAFFYPALRTNDKGEVVISFVMPESLTRWNFRGISHTKDMMTGNLSATTVTQKDFMLQPNMPRFVRMGDQATIAAVVANLTEKPVRGTVVFTLFDPITEKVIATQRQSFQAEGKGNASVSFGFEVTEQYNLLGVRLVADGGKFSDGEQHVLPVLSNKQFITETLAMPIRGNQTREFSTESLFNHQHPSATQKKLTVEFTGNPAWYAVQALPEISEPITDNAIAWASAFYGNTLASYIANSQPRIQQVFNRWKLEGGDKETLLSQLEKNQELKEILLSETPWVMEANTETERKQRLGIFFDLNQMSNRIQTDLIKLQGLQNEDGGWSWFSGMKSSFSTTTYITGLMIRLQMLLEEGKDGSRFMAQGSTVNEMKQKGFNFLHAEMLKHYQQMVKDYGKNSLPKYLSYMEMQYLYLIAIGDISVPMQNRQAYQHFLSLVENNLKDGDVIEKAQSAIIQQKAGKVKSAQEFINSLKEHMVDEDEMGAHFAFLDNPYTLTMIPVPQHVATMEALKYVGGNDELIEEMKMWLLKQKQTRGWNSSICTVDAIYALLCRGANLLENKGEVQITIGNHSLNTVNGSRSTVNGSRLMDNGESPDLGYVKESFIDNQTLAAPVIKVEKRDDGIAWGAAYAQYFAPMTDIQQHGKELNLERKLYVERIGTDGKKTLEQIGDGAQLRIGDVVVSRMTIELDRAMDYVQLKDRPAACFEPVAQLSGYRWSWGCYMEVEDAATNFFFDSLGKGLHVLEVRYRVQRAGTYQVGASTVQSAYAPDFASHSHGFTIKIKN